MCHWLYRNSRGLIKNSTSCRNCVHIWQNTFISLDLIIRDVQIIRTTQILAKINKVIIDEIIGNRSGRPRKNKGVYIINRIMNYLFESIINLRLIGTRSILIDCSAGINTNWKILINLGSPFALKWKAWLNRRTKPVSTFHQIKTF